jgi:CRP-like cAMP-binding protein
MGVLRPVAARQPIFFRGEDNTGMFCVLEGQLRASGTDDDGRTALLTVVEPPEWVGEIPLFDDLPRTHDVTAETDGLLVHLPHEPLLAFLEREPRYWRDMARLVVTKLRIAFAAMEDAQLLPIGSRLTRRLVQLAEGHGERKDVSRREVGVSQEMLAAMLSTSRQTVNQGLKELEAKGWVKLAYGRVEIVDLARLKASLRW